MSDERRHDRIIDAVYEGDEREALSAEEREEALALQRFREQLHARMQPLEPSVALRRRVMAAARAQVRERREPWAWLTWALAPAMAAMMAVVLWFGLDSPDGPDGPAGRAPSVASVEAPAERPEPETPPRAEAPAREAAPRSEEGAARGEREAAPSVVALEATLTEQPAKAPSATKKAAPAQPRVTRPRSDAGVVARAVEEEDAEAEAARELVVADTPPPPRSRPRKTRALAKEARPAGGEARDGRSRGPARALDVLKDVTTSSAGASSQGIKASSGIESLSSGDARAGAGDGVGGGKALGGVAGLARGSAVEAKGAKRDDSGLAGSGERLAEEVSVRGEARPEGASEAAVFEQDVQADKASAGPAPSADAAVADGVLAPSFAPADADDGAVTLTTVATGAVVAPAPRPARPMAQPGAARIALEDSLDEAPALEAEDLVSSRVEARRERAVRMQRAPVKAKAPRVDPCEDARARLGRATLEADRVEATRRLARCLVKDNRKAAARTLLQRALEEVGLSPAARDALLDEKARLGLTP